MPIQFMSWVVIITTKQDKANATELWKQAQSLGPVRHNIAWVSVIVKGGGGDLKKAKFHYEAAAMAGNEDLRFNIGVE